MITRRPIEEKGFTGVAVEADWPDAYRVNRYVRGAPEDADAEESPRGFRRSPTWMWRNAEVLDFVGWLRAHNDSRSPADAVGLYGLDLYRLDTSIEEVIAYLQKIDPPGRGSGPGKVRVLRALRRREPGVRKGGQPGISESCRRGVVEQLLELHRNSVGYLRRDGLAAEDAQFCAEQNARLVAAPSSATGRCSPPTSPPGTCGTRAVRFNLGLARGHPVAALSGCRPGLSSVDLSDGFLIGSPALAATER